MANTVSHLDLQGGYSSAQESGKDLQGGEKKSAPEGTATTRCDGTAGAELTPVFPDFGADKVPPTTVTWPRFLASEAVTWAVGDVSCKGLPRLAELRSGLGFPAPSPVLSPSQDTNRANVC